jgi:autotransporter-associated beta strand protein
VATTMAHYNNVLRRKTIGSLEGDGSVFLGSRSLTIGSNNQSTTFSGLIQNTGSLTKVGAGSLTLSRGNTYTGGTTISAGVLRINSQAGSGTGTGPLAVNDGTLGGKGIIAGDVTVGTGSGPGAFLESSIELSKPATLTIQSALTFKADSTYTCKLYTKRARADQLVADGVTIATGAQFNFAPVANKRLTAGTVFTAISNTSANPISGTFANLPDGSTFTVGRNNYQVSYSGSDGNDLTLTVVP